MCKTMSEFDAIKYIDQLKEMIDTNDFDFAFLQAEINFNETELEKYIRNHNTSSLKNAVLEALHRLSENSQEVSDNEYIQNELLYQYRELLIDTLIETIKGEKK